MPDRTITFLSFVAAALGVAYVGTMVVTVTFAAMQTDLALSVRDTESEISMLEARYYDEVGVLSDIDPYTMNLQKPVAVTYATAVQAPSLSLR